MSAVNPRITPTLLSSSSLLEDLNPAQAEAVQYKDGPLLIFAGAGSGKTRVLTRRISYLIAEHRVHPEQIFAVTFTNKAASEMKHRIMNQFSNSRAPSWVSTFHSSCARILREHAKLLDFTPNFAIYDSSDSRATMKRVFEKLKVSPKTIDPRAVLSHIDRAKNSYKFPESVRESTSLAPNQAELIAELYENYQSALQQANAMDFGDLLCHTVTLFKLEPDILRRYQEIFEYLLVDEYQDTNHVQYLLVKMLSEKYKNICVVGDDDQSIYAFRGATIQNILNFRSDFPDAKVVTLSTNYRSTKNILAVANAIISKNTTREKKEMTTDNAAGALITGIKAYDEREEAEILAKEIIKLFSEGILASNIAIFYRTNAQSRIFEEVLDENSIPFEIYGGHRFYDRKEIKDIMAYFRLILNSKDNEAFLRIINTPTRGLGATAVGGLMAFAAKQDKPLFESLEIALSENATFLTKANSAKFAKFISLIRELEKKALQTNELLTSAASQNTDALATLIKNIAEKSGYIAALKATDTLEAESRIENIFELYNVALDYVRRLSSEGAPVSLQGFLEKASLSSDLDSENSKLQKSKAEEFGGTVSLMTLHLAKGLEFDHVFLVGMEEGLLPHSHSLGSSSDVEEERRLCYVGITRAKQTLCLSRAISREMFGRSNWNSGICSRFVEDLPVELIDDKGTGFIYY
jgi:DNA helicase-2/ATP-dependent DNA helicase PcrA